MKFAKKYSPALIASLILLLFFNGLDYHNLGDIFRQGKFRWMFFGLCPISYYFFKKHLTGAVGAFVSAAIFSLTLHDYPLYGMMKFTLIIMTSLFAIWVVRLPKKFLEDCLILTGVFQSVVAVGQFFGKHYIFQVNGTYGITMPTGTFGHETILGPFLICCLAPALWRRVYWASVPILIGTLLTTSMMTYAALYVLILFYLWHSRSLKAAFWVFYFTLFVGVGGFFYLGGFNHPLLSYNGRQVYWARAWDAFKLHPLFGGGPGFWLLYARQIVGSVAGGVPIQVHNDWLENLVDYGCFLYLVLIPHIWAFVKKLRPTWHYALVCAILTNALGNFSLQIVPISLMLIVSLVYSMRSETPDGKFFD